MELWFSDSEVFAYDTLWVFKRQSDGRTEIFWNDPEGVSEFVATERPVLCGYNFRDYDSYILKATLLGWAPEDIHIVSTTIVENDERSAVWSLFNGQPWVELPPIIDLWPDIVPRKGLKEIEGNIGMDIRESSVPFDITRALTEDERDEVLLYCLHDVRATEKLYDLRFDYVKAKSDLCELRGIDPLTMLRHTNARIVSEVLGAQRLSHIPYEDYEIPSNIDISGIPDEVIAYVNGINTENCMDKGENKLEFMFYGCPTVFALGGIHAAIPKYQETSTDDRVILIQDIGSFYPSLIINNGYMSRAVSDPSIYKQFYDLRMKAKAEGDKATADAAKLVLNTTYGTFKDQYNALFDPMQGTRVCLSGQLYILDLIHQICSAYPSVQLIQLNTDGWVLSCDRDDRFGVEMVVENWQKRTGFTVDTDEIQKIVQANVNNYIIRMVDGRVKTKGGVVARYGGGDFKSNSNTIIDKAVVDYLLDGVPIEQTVASCDDLSRFQIIAKAGSTFQKVVAVVDGVEVEIQRINRVYATTDQTRGGIFKVKMADGVEVSRQKVPLTPPHCLIDNENTYKNGLTNLDRAWYIDLAKKKAHEFVTRDKKERSQMADTKEPVNEIEPATNKPATDKPAPRARKKAAPAEPTPEPTVPTFKQKLLMLQKSMAQIASKVEFDKVQTFGSNSSDYADTQQYKVKLGALCNELGLLFNVDFHQEWLGIISGPDATTPMFGVSVSGTVTISDVDSDEQEFTNIVGFGANVSPGFCTGVAETNAIRGYILNKYNLDNRGRDGDDQAMNNLVSNTTGYVSQAEKAQMTANIAKGKAADAEFATDLFAKALYGKIMEARKVEGHEAFGKNTLAHFEDDGTPKLGENGKSTLLKKDAVKVMNRAEEIING